MPYAPNGYQQKLTEDIALGQATRIVNISTLKALVAERFPAGSPLREIIMNEANELAADIFLARLPVWLQLSRLKTSR
jgi:hypothetical protein